MEPTIDIRSEAFCENFFVILMDMSLTRAIKGTILILAPQAFMYVRESSSISKHSCALRPEDPAWDLYLELFLTFFIFLQKTSSVTL